MTENRRVSAHETTFNGEKAICLQYGRYEAIALPECGGNLIAFRDTEAGFHFLHEPAADEMDAFFAKPTSYGIPFLFPPNRYEDGKFPWNGKVYQFPINETERNNHLHGFFHQIPWKVESFYSNSFESRLTMVQTVDPDHSAYTYFPHTFTIRLSYALSENGLHQHVMVKNEGDEPMPCLLAFHTAINVPFAKDSSPEDYRLKVTIGNRWEMNERMLPTGRFQPLSEQEEQMKNEGVYPFFAAMDNHYTAAPVNGSNRMELTDLRLIVTRVYDAGTAYRNWMIWNNNATVGFFCPEPQINVVNAPNTKLSKEESGLISLQPGEIWEETSRLYWIQK
jgi:aldose 1-epimerase